MTDGIVIAAPLSGWSVPLAEVPDAVFAQGMAGEGAAIDPASDTVLAPFDGVIVGMKGARHAVTVRHASGIEVLVHVGIDTVALGGEGFEMLALPGEPVRRAQGLLRFDLDRLARRAPSLVTPVVLTNGARLTRCRVACRISAGEDWLWAEPGEASRAAAEAGATASVPMRVPFEHGLHVRPAAQVAAALRPFECEVTLQLRGRGANARSTVAMMSLGADCGDIVEVRATGRDAGRAIEALRAVLAPVAEATPEPAAACVARFGRGRIEAVIASRGVAMGPAFQWSQSATDIIEEGGGEATETAALDRALADVRRSLASMESESGTEERALLRAHAELLQDPAIVDEARSRLARGKSAAFAWRAATRAGIALLEASADARMRERAADLRDLESQVLHALAGEAPAPGRGVMPGCIVLADELLPSQMISLTRAGAAGFCTAGGGATSHVALLAAASGMPALVAAGPRVLGVADGTLLVLDAEHGWLDVALPQAERAEVQSAIARRAAELAADALAAAAPCATLDGVRVVVHANLGSRDEVARAIAAGAEGCGLLRTEFLFLDRREAPDEAEQAREYTAIAAALGGRPLAIRTLDAGGDKPIAYLPQPREDNPALGLRGLRGMIDAPQLLATQLRAALRASAAGPCKVLLPMVTDLDDVMQARRALEEAARELGIAAVPLGAMIETPSSAMMAAELAVAVDFLSIGTNDLAQYTLAIDRGHPRLAGRLDALHPAVLRLIAQVAQAGRARGKPVSVCGALASDVDALPLLIGLGIREISATAASIPRLKRTARLLHAGECAELAQRALEQTSAAAVRELTAVARARPSPQPSPTPRSTPEGPEGDGADAGQGFANRGQT